jgi:hypothetical protein
MEAVQETTRREGRLSALAGGVVVLRYLSYARWFCEVKKHLPKNAARRRAARSNSKAAMRFGT